MQGHSLLPLIQHTSSEWQEEVFVQISESQVGRAIRTKRWKYCVVAPGLDGSQASGADTYREDCLYDLLADPYELRNLVQNEAVAEVKRDLRERLARRMSEAGEAVPEIVEAPLTEKRGQRVIEPLTFIRKKK